MAELTGGELIAGQILAPNPFPHRRCRNFNTAHLQAPRYWSDAEVRQLLASNTTHLQPTSEPLQAPTYWSDTEVRQLLEAHAELDPELGAVRSIRGSNAVRGIRGSNYYRELRHLLLLRHPGFRHSQDAIKSKIQRLKGTYEKLRDLLEQTDQMEQSGCSSLAARIRTAQIPEWFVLLDPVMSRSQGRTSTLLLNSARAIAAAAAAAGTAAAAVTSLGRGLLNQSSQPLRSTASPPSAPRDRLLSPSTRTGRQMAGPDGAGGRQMAGPDGAAGRQMAGPDGAAGWQMAGPDGAAGWQVAGPDESRGSHGRAGSGGPAGRPIARPDGAAGWQMAGPGGLAGWGRKRDFAWRGREMAALSPAKAGNVLRADSVMKADDAMRADELSAAVVEEACAEFEDVMQDWAESVCAEFEESVAGLAKAACFQFNRLTRAFAESWKAGRGTTKRRRQ
ncbi:hypothetical protein CLOM_g15667 [Closterium sp. NIES-68]|nr:hypothetical protein CLOM_g15667 [Closterium sp. NIES-68]